MPYRTRTYIAGDWTGDANLISRLQYWNESSFWNLSYLDAHDLTQARDTSLPCSIKKSLKNRLDASKRFVLVVGDKTLSLTKGGCRYCTSYSIYGGCHRFGSVDNRSFIEYECEYAVRHGLHIVVIYNDCFVDKDKCPSSVRYRGVHLPAMYLSGDGEERWNVAAIDRAISD